MGFMNMLAFGVGSQTVIVKLNDQKTNHKIDINPFNTWII